jgi:PIN domain nuclease of toxin-antitoxin system
MSWLMTSGHALAVDALPLLHKDPFDRMLIAQAQVEGMVLLTSDAQMARYPGAIQKV